MYKLVFVLLIFSVSAKLDFFQELLGGKSLNGQSRHYTENKFQTLGSACGNGPNNCDQYYNCDFGNCLYATNTCVIPQKLNLGDSCNAYDYCINGTCVISGIYAQTGTCQKLLDVGCPCNYNTTVGGNYQLNVNCDTRYCFIDGKCNYLRSVGSPCSQSYECTSNSCINNSCQTNNAIGSNCSYPDLCPANTYCSTQRQCTQYLPLGGNCTTGTCGGSSYCDTTTKICNPLFNKVSGANCSPQPPFQCVFSNYCASNGTCVPSSSQINLPCNNTNTCKGDTICTCNNGQTTCQILSNINCDSQVSSLISCINTNCFNYPSFGVTQTCATQQCNSQLASMYCCQYNNPPPNGQNIWNHYFDYVDCSRNVFIGSPCDNSNTSHTSNTSSIRSPFIINAVALLFILIVNMNKVCDL